MNYYNEWDERTAAWLRELIRAGAIPHGDVDTRSICDVQPDDLRGYTQCHFFAGIGGWSEALRLAGWPTGRPVWTGSCPCQPFSCAGKQAGQNDERHLWPAFFNLIRERQPQFVFGEQVANAIGHGWLDGVFADLEGEAYACGAVVLGAHSVRSPHIRQRLYWMAHTNSGGWTTRSAEAGSSEAETFSGQPIVGLAHSKSGGQREHGSASRETGYADECGKTGGLADSQSQRLRETRSGGGQQPVVEQSGRAIDRMADREQPGLERHAGDVRDRDQSGRYRTDAVGSVASGGCIGNPWDDSRTIQCRDGKARRIPNVESSVQLLADGLPAEVDLCGAESGFPLSKKIKGRVMLLKGYGNAIIPQVAAAFIKATGLV